MCDRFQLQEEKIAAIQEKLELAEQKLAQFAKMPEMEEQLKARMEALTQVRNQVRGPSSLIYISNNNNHNKCLVLLFSMCVFRRIALFLLHFFNFYSLF